MIIFKVKDALTFINLTLGGQIVNKNPVPPLYVTQSTITLVTASILPTTKTSETSPKTGIMTWFLSKYSVILVLHCRMFFDQWKIIGIFTALPNCTAPCRFWYPEELKGSGEKVCREYGSCYQFSAHLPETTCSGEICIPYDINAGTSLQSIILQNIFI